MNNDIIDFISSLKDQFSPQLDAASSACQKFTDAASQTEARISTVTNAFTNISANVSSLKTELTDISNTVTGSVIPSTDTLSSVYKTVADSVTNFAQSGSSSAVAWENQMAKLSSAIHLSGDDFGNLSNKVKTIGETGAADLGKVNNVLNDISKTGKNVMNSVGLDVDMKNLPGEAGKIQSKVKEVMDKPADLIDKLGLNSGNAKSTVQKLGNNLLEDAEKIEGNLPPIISKPLKGLTTFMKAFSHHAGNKKKTGDSISGVDDEVAPGADNQSISGINNKAPLTQGNPSISKIGAKETAIPDNQSIFKITNKEAPPIENKPKQVSASSSSDSPAVLNPFSSNVLNKKPFQDQSKATNNGFSGGGGNVTINVGKLFDSIQFHGTSVKEDAKTAGNIVVKEMLRILNSANKIPYGQQ